MTRGNQREIDRARAQARAEKHAKPEKGDHSNKLVKAMSDADKMREKQRKADLKKQGIVEEEAKPKKEFDQSYLTQYNFDEEEEEKQPAEEEKKEEVIQPKGKKGKKWVWNS